MPHSWKNSDPAASDVKGTNETVVYLKKAIEGRIQKEIHDGKCDKYTSDVKEKRNE